MSRPDLGPKPAKNGPLQGAGGATRPGIGHGLSGCGTRGSRMCPPPRAGGGSSDGTEAGFRWPHKKPPIGRTTSLHLAAVPQSSLYPRFTEVRLVEALEDTPAVLVHGPRQCGKTTLAKVTGERLGYAYFSLDDPVTREAARSDPVGFVGDLPKQSILDEVQRVPALFTSLKTVIDRERIPGRFLLTGSTNLLLMPTLSDSLAGRMGTLRLHPLARCELERRDMHFLPRLFEGELATRTVDRLGSALAEMIVAGGYPAALSRPVPRRRAAWYRDYVEALVLRDVRDLARVTSLDVLPRLLALASAQTGRLVNVSDLASPFQVSRPTIRDYVTLLERLFLLERLPPWHSNRLSRLIKTPKLHMGDTGVATALLGVDADALRADRTLLGQLVETFVYQELHRQVSWQQDSFRLHHFRDKDGAEVDIVLERGTGHVAGVEVKASATVTRRDFRGLRRLQAAAGERFVGGVVLYDGESEVGFGAGLRAVPLRTLWEA